MKKIIVILMCVFMMMGCSSSNSNEETNNPTIPNKQIVWNEKTVALGDEMGSLLSILGDNYELTEAKSCMYDGNDKTYDYGDFVVVTYPDGDKDYINSITFKGENVDWSYDIHVNDNVDKIETVLKEGNTLQEDDLWLYELDDYNIAFYLENQTIVEIEIYSW